VAAGVWPVEPADQVFSYGGGVIGDVLEGLRGGQHIYGFIFTFPAIILFAQAVECIAAIAIHQIS